MMEDIVKCRLIEKNFVIKIAFEARFETNKNIRCPIVLWIFSTKTQL